MDQEKFIIATHYLLYGSAHALRDYLIDKKKEILFIALPFFTQRNTITEEYKLGEIVNKSQKKRENEAQLKGYALDFYEIIHIVLSQKKKYHVFIGVNNLNCLSGLILKKLGKVKKVIYYSIDFVPIRFTNRVINYIYHEIEKFCIRNADETWNVSPRIAEGREKFLNISAKKYYQKVVPIGVWNKNITKVPFANTKKHQALFMGHLLEKQGVQEVIRAIPEIIKKIPEFSLLILGDGEYKNELVKIVKSLDIQSSVVFTGWIEKREEVDKMMSESAFALATYMPEAEKLHNFTYYADPTKIKDYLSAGLPVILTDVSYNAREIEKRECGIVVEYEKKDIAKEIIILLKNEKKLKKYRQNALNYARDFDWENIFTKALYE